MTFCPITVQPLQPYYGNDPKKQRKFENDVRAARSIASYINRQMETEHRNDESAIFTFGEIALAVGLDEMKVHHYLLRFSGSSDNSIEIHRPKA